MILCDGTYRVSQIIDNLFANTRPAKGRLTSALTLSVYLYTLRETDTFFFIVSGTLERVHAGAGGNGRRDGGDKGV